MVGRPLNRSAPLGPALAPPALPRLALIRSAPTSLAPPGPASPCPAPPRFARGVFRFWIRQALIVQFVQSKTRTFHGRGGLRRGGAGLGGAGCDEGGAGRCAQGMGEAGRGGVVRAAFRIRIPEWYPTMTD